MAKRPSQTAKRRKKTSKLLTVASCGLAFGLFAVSSTLLTVSQLIFTSKRSVTVKLMVYRSSKVVKSFPVAWIVVPFMTMSSSLRPMNGNLGLILAIKMKLINSPKIHKFRTSLLQRSIRFVTVTFKNIAFSSLFQLYLWDPLVLVSQSTFKMYFLTNFLGKTT